MGMRLVKGSKDLYDVRVYRRVATKGTKPVPMTKRVKGLRAAQKVEAQFINLRDSGTPEAASERTFGAYAASWLEGKRSEDVARQTLQHYRLTLNKHLVPRFGSRTLASLRPEDVRLMMTELKDAGLAANTRQHVFRELKMILSAAVGDRYLTVNPCEGIKAPRSEQREVEALTDAEVADLLARLKGSDLYPVAVLMLGSGLRREEALALHWSDVDAHAGTVTVKWAVAQVNGWVGLKEPKSTRGRRTVPVSVAVMDVLHQQRRAQAEAKMAHRDRWDAEGSEDFVFGKLTTTPQGVAWGVWTPFSFSTAWTRATKGLKATPHTCRHTFITRLLLRGEPLEQVSRLAGHSKSSMTLNTYSHVLRDRQPLPLELPGL